MFKGLFWKVSDELSFGLGAETLLKNIYTYVYFFSGLTLNIYFVLKPCNCGGAWSGWVWSDGSG